MALNEVINIFTTTTLPACNYRRIFPPRDGSQRKGTLRYVLNHNKSESKEEKIKKRLPVK